MDEKKLLHYFKESLAECRESMQGIRSVWEACHERYMCRKDWSKKKEWQFRIYTPIAKPKVKRAVNLIKTTLLRSGEYFDFDTPVRNSNDPQYIQDLLRCNYTKRLVKAHLDARSCMFLDNFTEALESGFGWSGMVIMKFWVGYVNSGWFDMPRNEYVKREELALRSKAIDPFLFDFTPDRTIQIEHQYVTMPELWEGVDRGDFDSKVVSKLMESDYGDHSTMKDEEKERLRRLNIAETQNEYRSEVLLSHFWGPVLRKDGRTTRLKVENPHAHFIVANEKYLLTPIMGNPYPDKSTPYVFDRLIRVPFRHVGKALTEDVNCIEDAIVDLVNMQADNGLWQMLGVTEIDQLALTGQDKYQLKELYPGVPIVRRPGTTELAFKRHEMGTDPQRIMPLLQELKLFHDADHGVNDLTNGNLPSMGMDGGEKGQARIDALTQFEGFATDLERGVFTRCIDKARDLILQFMADPESDPNARKILGDSAAAIDNLPEKERRGLIVSEYNITARGISIFFERLRKQNAYTGVYKMINALPDEAKVWIKWESFIPRILESTAIDAPEDLLRSPDEVKQIQEAQRQAQMQAMEFEMRKLMAPLEVKMEQTQMGIQERVARELKRIEADLRKAMLQIDQKDRQAKLKLVADAMHGLLEDEKHKDKIDLERTKHADQTLLNMADFMLGSEPKEKQKSQGEGASDVQ